MPHKYHWEAPDTFRGRASIAKEFIEEVEIILTQYKVTTDLDKIKGLLRYCSRSVTKFIRTLNSFHSPDWERLKVEFLHYYDADQEDDDNRPLDLVRFVEENKREPMESLGAWLKYYHDYMTMATPLVNNETLSDRHYKTLSGWVFPMTFSISSNSGYKLPSRHTLHVTLTLLKKLPKSRNKISNATSLQRCSSMLLNVNPNMIPLIQILIMQITEEDVAPNASLNIAEGRSPRPRTEIIVLNPLLLLLLQQQPSDIKEAQTKLKE
jgi:hypothetical protein